MRTRLVATFLWMLGCGTDAASDTRDASATSVTSPSTTLAPSTGGDDPDTTEGPDAGPTTDDSATTAVELTTSGADSTSGTSGGPGCTFCDAPNEVCIDDACVTTCQGQVPDPCGAGTVCDHISGECVDPATTECVLSGTPWECGDQRCGPGSVCNDEGQCVAYPPCAGVACTDDGSCWGTFCSCERSIDCEPPTDEELNGPFSTEISDLEFADDCTAWMVTLRSGTDFVRRLTTDGELTEWDGVSNLNMGEIAVLKALTPPPGAAVPLPVGHGPLPPPTLVEGVGEVAISYICCASCGCAADPPQGVARLIEDDLVTPLPLVIPAVVTSGTGPFGSAGADAGPFGLTWGIDRVLYVGNSTANGDLHTSDLETKTQEQVTAFKARVTAAAPLTESHIAVATIGGEVFRYNVVTDTQVSIADFGVDVTNMSFDAFSGLLYVSLRDLSVVTLHPFTMATAPFETMAGRGRVTVSPNGRLYYSPIRLVENHPIMSWDIPDTWQ